MSSKRTFIAFFVVGCVAAGCVYKAVQKAEELDNQFAAVRCVRTSVAMGGDPTKDCPGAATALGQNKSEE